jgi:mannose-6-phosphate isomerase-like protein (cupin superfamily)
LAAVFTDIEGSTALLRRLGIDSYAQLLADHHRIIRTSLEAHGGSEQVRIPDYIPLGGKMAEMTTAIVDSPDNPDAQAWWFLDTLVVEHRRASEMETVVLEMTLPVGSAPPLHVHDDLDDLDDTWYILDGEMVVRFGDDELVVAAGHWVSMPRGVPHTFRVVGDHDARILLVHDNASFRDFIREVSTPAVAHVVPTEPYFPPMDELARLAAVHDLRPMGPPMSVEESAAVLAAVGDA